LNEPPIIELEKISKSFGSVSALAGISMQVNDNEVLGLIGDNGAGKSTLIKIISGVHAPDSGEILVRGESVYTRARQGHILSAGFGVILIGFAGFNVLLAQTRPHWDLGHVGAYTPVIALMYVVAMRTVFRYETLNPAAAADDAPLRSAPGLRQALVRYALAALVVVGAAIGAGAAAVLSMAGLLAVVLVLHAVLLFAELGVTHASTDVARAARLITRGGYRGRFWGGAVAAGIALPLVAILAIPGGMVVGALLALAGLWVYEDIWVKAGQSIPLS